jgi:hypothetical protein
VVKKLLEPFADEIAAKSSLRELHALRLLGEDERSRDIILRLLDMYTPQPTLEVSPL